MFHNILYILLFAQCALSTIVSTNIGPVDIEPGFRVRFYQVSISDTSTDAETKDFLTNQQYVSEGTLLGQLNGITEITVKYNRYHNDFIHGFYIDPDEVKQFVVEFRGYIRKMEDGRLGIRWLSPSVKACGANLRRRTGFYARVYPDTYLDNSASDTLCLNDNTQESAQDNIFAGNENISASGNFNLSKYVPGMWYPIILAAFVGGDGLNGEFWYGIDQNYSQMGPENSGYNPNDDYEYFDENRATKPVAKRCPQYDKDNYVEPQVPPPFVTTPYTCPVTSSTTPITITPSSSSETYITSSESIVDPSSSESVIEPEPSNSESTIETTYSESVVVPTSSSLPIEPTSSDQSIQSTSSDPSIEPTSSLDSSMWLSSDPSLTTTLYESSLDPTSSSIFTEDPSSVWPSISSAITESSIDITSDVPHSSTESSSAFTYSSSTTNIEPQPSTTVSDAATQTQPSPSDLTDVTRSTTTQDDVSTSVVPSEHPTNPDSSSTSNHITDTFTTNNSKEPINTVTVVTTVTHDFDTDVFTSEVTIGPDKTIDTTNTEISISDKHTDQPTESPVEPDSNEVLSTCQNCASLVTKDGSTDEGVIDGILTHSTTTLETPYDKNNNEISSVDYRGTSKITGDQTNSDAETTAPSLVDYMSVTSESSTMLHSVEDFVGEGSIYSTYTSFIMLFIATLLL